MAEGRGQLPSRFGHGGLRVGVFLFCAGGVLVAAAGAFACLADLDGGERTYPGLGAGFVALAVALVVGCMWSAGAVNHPGIAFYIMLATTALVVGAAAFGVSRITPVWGRPSLAWGAVWEAVAALILVGGSWMAWRAGTGQWSLRRYQPEEWSETTSRHTGAPGGRWQVAAPGVDLTTLVAGGDLVAHLVTGTTVTEVRRTGSRVLVYVADGLSGWVDEDRLQPPGTGDGEGGR